MLRLAARDEPDLAHQLPPVPDEVTARRLIGEWRQDPFGRHLAVTADDEAVGRVAVTHLDPAHGTGWVSYWMRADWRGRGWTTAAVASVCDWALTATGSGGLGLYRLELGHRTENVASALVAERAGFLPEGLERGKFLIDGERKDVRTMARLVDDPWPGLPAIPIRS